MVSKTREIVAVLHRDKKVKRRLNDQLIMNDIVSYGKIITYEIEIIIMLIERWCFPNKANPELIPADTRQDHRDRTELSFCH